MLNLKLKDHERGLPWFRQRGRFGGRLPCRASADSAVCRSWRLPVSVSSHNRHQLEDVKLYEKSSSGKDNANKLWSSMARFYFETELIHLTSSQHCDPRAFGIGSVSIPPRSEAFTSKRRSLPRIAQVQLLQQGHLVAVCSLTSSSSDVIAHLRCSKVSVA